MIALAKSQQFKVVRLLVKNGGFTYYSYRVEGRINGRRIRRQFKDPDQAHGEKLRLEVQAANAPEVRTVHTRLTHEQLADAEGAVRRLAGVPLSSAVEWYLANYRPPIEEMALPAAIERFLTDKQPHVGARVYREYRRELGRLQRAFPGLNVHEFSAETIHAHLTGFGLGKKGWNNLRGYLHAFFEWAMRRPRKWTAENPVKEIEMFKITRGVPEILTAARVVELFEFLEDYSGGDRQRAQKGCLVPYFALCTFAGIRPAVPSGEVWKMARLPSLERVIDLANGVIRIGPDIAKTRDLRQVTIQPNLRAWLARYPLEKYPLIVPNMADMIRQVRKKFNLSHDVLRHTFISMHVAKFKSLGATALEAGNTERIIKKHYLNSVTEQEAEKFWAILGRQI